MGASLLIIAVVAIIVAAAALAALAYVLSRARAPAQPEGGAVADLTRAQSEAAARLEAMIGMLAKGQSQLAHAPVAAM